jgi:hypothetical protein
MRFAILFILVISMFSTNLAHAVEFNDGPQARDVLTRQVRTLFENGNFQELDKIADGFRKNKSRFPDGVWKLQIFYTGFDMSGGVPDVYFPHVIELARKWQEANPRSVTAQCVLASVWRDYAWKARGSGYANTVKEEARPVVRERLDKAWQIVNKPLAPGVADCPRRHDLRLNLAQKNGLNRDKYEEIFKEAIQQAPDYYQHYTQKAAYLLPKWSGKEGEWQSFIMKIAEQNPRGEGATIYTRVVWSMYLGREISDLNDSGISWPKMRDGFKEIDRNYPNSRWILNNTAKFACRAKDEGTLRTTLKRVDQSTYYPEAWKDTNINDCRSWIGLPPFATDSSQPH